jgi:hypothetical protein
MMGIFWERSRAISTQFLMRYAIDISGRSARGRVRLTHAAYAEFRHVNRAIGSSFSTKM